MTTLLKLGPADQGRSLTLEEFLAGDYQEGYQYELIDGRLCVSPAPSPPGRILEMWALFKLHHYSQAHLEVANFACHAPRVFVPDRPEATTPEPDAALYRDFPLEAPLRDIRWEDHSPILVVEVLSEDDPDKDLVRNVDLYLLVPSIREYWILDGRDDPNRPTLTVRRRHGKRWVVREYSAGQTFTTKLLPGFELLIDPRC